MSEIQFLRDIINTMVSQKFSTISPHNCLWYVYHVTKEGVQAVVVGALSLCHFMCDLSSSWAIMQHGNNQKHLFCKR